MKAKTCLLGLFIWVIAIAGAQAQSVIRINFADPGIADISVSGRAANQPYGISESPAVARARAEVAMRTPPPEYQAFGLSWQPIRAEQSANVAEPNGSNVDYAYGYDRTNNGFNGFNYYGAVFNATHPVIESLTEWAPLPLFDTEAYLAALAAWQREQVRARLVLGR